jgi:hypothetical protein
MSSEEMALENINEAAMHCENQNILLNAKMEEEKDKVKLVQLRTIKDNIENLLVISLKTKGRLLEKLKQSDNAIPEYLKASDYIKEKLGSEASSISEV